MYRSPYLGQCFTANVKDIPYCIAIITMYPPYKEPSLYITNIKNMFNNKFIIHLIRGGVQGL